MRRREAPESAGRRRPERQSAIVHSALASWFDVKATQGAPKEECAEIIRLLQLFSGASMRPDA